MNLSPTPSRWFRFRAALELPSWLRLGLATPLLFLPLWNTGGLFGEPARPAGIPDGFVDLKKVVPEIQIDLKYFTAENFTGEPVDGYTANRCWITRQAALKLALVQAELRPYSLGLKVFDAYRPQSAVDHFVRWTMEPNQVAQQQTYHPGVSKTELIEKGYISDRSGHSRGSTVDLTIVDHADRYQGAPRELDMGTPFDFFGPQSAGAYPELSAQQRSNRLLLKTIMERHGFKGYSKEWWHFRLENERYPETSFNFPTGGTAPPQRSKQD